MIEFKIKVKGQGHIHDFECTMIFSDTFKVMLDKKELKTKI